MLRATSLAFVLVASLSTVRAFVSAGCPHPHPSRRPASTGSAYSRSLRPLFHGTGTGRTPGSPEGNDIQRQQAIAANAQRQVEIRRDTDKMLQLTAELKDYLQKAEHGVMSVDAIKKAEQIEKLAHGVKSKMKQSF